MFLLRRMVTAWCKGIEDMVAGEEEEREVVVDI
jgi:hypothetical protein